MPFFSPITLGINQNDRDFLLWSGEYWGLERVVLDRYLFGQSEKPEDDKWPVFAHFPTEILALLEAHFPNLI